MSPEDQIEVYRAQVFIRHLECLEDDYPTLRTLLGDEGFQHLVRGYLTSFPPTSFSLRDLGVHLIEHVSTSPDIDPSARSLLVDVARLEWALIEAFDAPSLPPLDPRVLADAGEDIAAMRFVTCPSLHLLALDHPIHDVRAAIDEDAPWSVPPKAPTFLAVHRPAQDPVWFVLSARAYEALGHLDQGIPLGDAFDRVAAGLSEADVAAMESEVGGWVREWVVRGVVRGLERGPR